MLGRKQLQHYGLGMKQGLHTYARLGSKTLQYATPIAGLVNPELGVASEVASLGLKGLQKITK